jgi:hypothetical protein
MRRIALRLMRPTGCTRADQRQPATNKYNYLFLLKKIFAIGIFPSFLRLNPSCVLINAIRHRIVGFVDIRFELNGLLCVWDDSKAKRNQQKHGIGFEEAW